MAITKIEWTDTTWNPVTGCSKVSSGCKNCYAERMAERLKAMNQKNYADGFNVTLHPHVLDYPLRWKKPKTVFVNSMSDLFHEHVPKSFIENIFHVMQKAHWHRFQVLTKRSARLKELGSEVNWPDNVWIGVSVENADNTYRIDDLRNIPASIRFLSLEPLLGPLKSLNLHNIDWVIVGGESGPRAREMKKEWILPIRNQCIQEKIPFFFKQWGGINKKQTGRLLDGRTWDEMPVSNVQLKAF